MEAGKPLPHGQHTARGAQDLLSVCVRVDIFIYMHVQMYIYLYTDVCTCRNVCVLCINTYADTYVYYVHIDVYKQN